jgi:hypothetical protein
MVFFVEFDINNDIYRVMRLVLRFVLTLMIVFGLLFYGTGLFARIKSLNLNVSDKKVYMKVGFEEFVDFLDCCGNIHLCSDLYFLYCFKCVFLFD